MADGMRAPEPVSAEALRARIDAGVTGDKVPFPDPAAAPLGTDAEAAGFPPQKSELRLAARSLKGAPRTSRRGDERDGIITYAVLVAGVALLILLTVALA